MGRGIYIAGAGKDAGKTTLCLGLLEEFRKSLPEGVAFTKPLGQKTTLVEGEQVGQDSWFVDRALHMELSLDNSAPFVASSGSAARYIKLGEPSDLPGRIRRAYKSLSRKGRMVVVEGTGHPGVGSVFDMSNARVAKILGTPVILVLDGGIGSTIDRYSICASMFHNLDVPVLGVVINRIVPSKMESVKTLLGKWFGERGIAVFGYIPYEDSIARPSFGLIQKALGAEPVVSLETGTASSAAGYLTAFGSAEKVLRIVGKNPRHSLLVDHSRPDILDALVVSRVSGGKGPAAVIVCGGEPDSRRTEALRITGIPLYATGQGLEKSAGKLSQKIFKVEPHEEEKIRSIVELVEAHVDFTSILSHLYREQSGESFGKKPGSFKRFLRKIFKR
ncbi:MAG: AAA family ATPase [Candidatus Sabulitectum sp.]|nr:AAA family ATPase [Candidatus Sabulitectum sp.]